ncbi:MAG: beta galactosidase jelly roll domain-containing protein [Deltaproteobacteria bacterium]|nr:beta galactosidase jelly roll domain-containing protein [Deltaproteobacteria bacterium]
MPLDTDWRFLRSDASDANDTGFDDSSWKTVSVPHTWNAMDGQDGGNDYYRGIGWYRRHFVLPADAAGKRVYIQFDGGSIVTDVWVNGTSLGQHRGGFARFRFDATAALNTGADNVVAVRIDNSLVADVPPISGDFTVFGGLYRSVSLLVTDRVHIDTQDFASSGVYLETTNVSEASADLRARVRVKNDEPGAQDVTVSTIVVRPDGGVEARLTASGTVGSGATEELVATTTLPNPHLWDGLTDPFVYSAYVELAVQGEVRDWLVEPLGFRSYAVDPEEGFLLNGRYVDLHGVNRHQDRLDMGWAITEREHDEDMALIREVGANIIRLSHYQQSKYFHELADQTGMVLWTEIPLINEITHSNEHTANARQQLQELIRQNFNHPSILFWGIGNEQRTDDSATNTLLGDLADLAAVEDPGRLSTYAHCCAPDTGGLPSHSNLVGYNTYFGWYDNFGTYDQFGDWADALHAARPTWRIGIGEYGAGAALSQHQIPPMQPEPYGSFHPEEWQSLIHDEQWRQMNTRRYLWAKIVWCMFDFASDGRSEGETAGRNDKGLVSYDRQTRKDAFFFYKASWTATPTVHIASRRYTNRTTATVVVTVYSNADQVTLRVNGTTVGTELGTNHTFEWASVPLCMGSNTLEASATIGGVDTTDTVTLTRI